MAPLPSGLRRGYALGGIATGTYGTVPGLLLMPYLTEVIGIKAALAGLVVFLPKAWDFVLNPVAGRISDRSTNPRGRRRPIIRRAGMLMALGFLLIFIGPTAPAGLATAWVVAAFLGAASAYAFFQVPYLAMSAEITEDYGERTRLMMWRVIVITGGIMVAGASAPLLVEAFGGAQGYRVMAAVMAMLIVAGTWGLWFGTRKATLTRHETTSGTLREQLLLVVRSPHVRTLLVAFVLQAVAMTMVLAGINYTARHVMGDPAVATYAFVAFVGPAIVVSPLWERFGLRWGKKAGFAATSVVLVVGLLALTAARGGNLGVLLGASAVVGVGYAGSQLFPLAMLPDLAAHDAVESGHNRIGLLTGTWSAFELLGFALGPAVYGFVLSLGGYVSGAESQSDGAVWAILAGISIVPAVLVLLSLVALSRYRLDRVLRTEEVDSAVR